MKITKLETFGNEFVTFTRVTTETGATGWGQLSTYNADITTAVFHRQVARHALGTDIAMMEDTLDLIGEREHKYPGSYLRRAQTGLDTAVWDLRGKLAGKPVVELRPIKPEKAQSPFGLWKGRTRILDDIMEPVVPAEDWDALK